jgi:long-chain acyl-CoA synthetase
MFSSQWEAPLSYLPQVASAERNAGPGVNRTSAGVDARIETAAASRRPILLAVRYAVSVRTVFTVLEETARRQGNAIALHQPAAAKGGPGYRTYTWTDWLEISREIALGLYSLGLRKGDVACVLSETRAEFYLTDLGIMAAGGVSAALYTSYPMREQAISLQKIEPQFLFLEDPKTFAALLAADPGRLPKHIVLLTGEADGALSLNALRELGRELAERDPGTFERIKAQVTPADPAILYLTSGATGTPKMSLSSHAAILFNLDEHAPLVLPVGPEDSLLVFLPSAHIAQRVVLELAPMRLGVPVWFSESLSKMPGELRKIRPTLFLAPPRVWERIYATVCSEVRRKPALARKIFHGALGLGMEAHRRRLAGAPLPGWMSRALKIADRVVFSKVRERLGGRLRLAISGAAPLGKDLAEFFSAIGMPIVEGYGLTEAGILCFNPFDRPKPGSIGKFFPGVETRLAGDGELFVKAASIFSGYYKDDSGANSVLTDDGWMATGDIAEVDSEGYWYITGRKKELIVSSNGKKVYPARIETLFKLEPVVNQIVLLGDKQPYVTALITVNPASLPLLKGMDAYKDKTHAEMAEARPVLDAVQTAVSRVNKQLADFERIRRFRILPRDFSIEEGELTPTMKIRRAKVIENHRGLVSELYLGKEES